MNNRPGKDGGLLERYDEPAYNNPIVRFFDGDGEELVERRSGVWDAYSIASRMIASLQRAERDVPPWLALARDELSPRLPERAVFGMHCFWQGEAALGGLEGVLATRPGWLGGGEVVEVLFDPGALPYPALVRAAREADCARVVWADGASQLRAARELVGQDARELPASPSDAKPSDRLWNLRRSPLRHLPLTPLQAIRVNAALGTGGDPARWLSPSQRALAARLRAALERDATVLDGLERPDDLEALEAYRRELLARLG